MHRSLALALMLLSCKGGKDDDPITPIDETDADADTDADSDADADTDADTDVVPGRCDPLPAPTGDTIDVAVGAILADEVAAAPAGATLLLADGEYLQLSTLVIDKPLTIRSASGDRAAVVIDGRHANLAGDLVRIESSDVTLAHLTLEASYEDMVQVIPNGADITGVRLHDLVMTDPARFAVNVEGDGAEHWVDQGELTCSHLELTDAGRPEVRGDCETGGIDAYGARGWTVRDNTILGFWCEFDHSGPGIRFWRGSRDVTVTRNLLGDVQYGIVLGETQDQIGRTYDDDPCGGILQAIDATATNNIVYAYDNDILYSAVGVLSGIRAESSCNVQILHNSVYSVLAPEAGSIDHRYATTTGVMANNLASHLFLRLDDSQLVLEGNVENAAPDTWVHPAGRDFHTSPAATWALDQGVTDYLGVVTDDFDAEPRDDGLPDVGADER